MPMKPEEVLNKLVAATQEARDTMRALHEARKEYSQTVQREEAQVREDIRESIRRAVEEIKILARQDMHDSADEAISEFSAALRGKLGL